MSVHGARGSGRAASWKAVGLIVSVAAAVGAWSGVGLLSYGVGWAALEGFIVFAVLVMAQIVSLSRFGRWVRKREAAERLAARNASIRAGLGSSVLL